MALSRGFKHAAPKGKQQLFLKGFNQQKQVALKEGEEAMREEQMKDVFCRGMGQEAMAQNYPKIKDYLNNSNQNVKAINSDFEHLFASGDPSSCPTLQALQVQGSQISPEAVQSISVADGQLSVQEYFDNQAGMINEKLIDRSFMKYNNVIASDQQNHSNRKPLNNQQNAQKNV